MRTLDKKLQYWEIQTEELEKGGDYFAWTAMVSTSLYDVTTKWHELSFFDIPYNSMQKNGKHKKFHNLYNFPK